jgi:putative (di)nucleoside polyphosphate hydrolase
MYRELDEETGLGPDHVDVLGSTRGWLRYRLPSHAMRQGGPCIGQKQVWFLLRFNGEDADVRLDRQPRPEFDQWRWVDFWYPLEHVVRFKRGVYVRALGYLAAMARDCAGADAIPPCDAEHAGNQRLGRPCRGLNGRGVLSADNN